MTAAVEALGVHVPRWSLDRRELAAVWQAAGGAGHRTVANYDEDVVTMGVEAALAAFGGDAEAIESIDAVLFATTTPVFLEKQHAAVVAAALRIRATLCLDITGTLRAGLDALRTASSLVGSGAAERVLVVAADRRDPQPGSAHERMSGDAGAAVLVTRGSRRPLGWLTGGVGVADPAAGVWRGSTDGAVRVADERFVTTQLLTPWLVDAVRLACGEVGLQPDAMHAAALAAPLPKGERSAADLLGVPGGPADLDRDVGYTGVTHPFLQLALALADRRDGEHVVVAAAGDGATAVTLTVGEGVDGAAAQALRAALGRRRPLAAGTYLRMRGQLPVEPVRPFTSEMLLRREQSTGLELRGCRCGKCGRTHFPSRRICLGCRAADLMDPLELPRAGALFTHTVEHLFPVPTNELIMGVVEVDDVDGVRVYTQVTDTDPDECAPGRRVELVLRRLHDGGHLPHYFWKAKVIPS